MWSYFLWMSLQKIGLIRFDLKFQVNSSKLVLEKFKLRPMSSLNPHTPVAQKITNDVVFRHFQGEGVEFS